MEPTRCDRAGFTLIELLVVVGVIAVLAGVVGVGLSRGGEGATLAAGRALFIAQVEAARSRAALNGEGAAVAVTVDETDEEVHLRDVFVVEPAGNGWQQVAEPERLPGENRVRLTRSSLLSGPVSATNLTGAGTVSCYLIPFDSRGRLAGADGGQLWLGSETAEADELGLVISRYGVMSEVEDTP